MLPMVTTPLSTGSTLRATMLCSACTMAAATTIGSVPACGIAPWAPRPVMSISMFATAAMTGPTRQWNSPSGMLGQLWSPNTRSMGKRSNRPSFTIISPPPKFSSAGWKIT